MNFYPHAKTFFVAGRSTVRNCARSSPKTFTCINQTKRNFQPATVYLIPRLPKLVIPLQDQLHLTCPVVVGFKAISGAVEGMFSIGTLVERIILIELNSITICTFIKMIYNWCT